METNETIMNEEIVTNNDDVQIEDVVDGNEIFDTNETDDEVGGVPSSLIIAGAIVVVGVAAVATVKIVVPAAKKAAGKVKGFVKAHFGKEESVIYDEKVDDENVVTLDEIRAKVEAEKKEAEEK